MKEKNEYETTERYEDLKYSNNKDKYNKFDVKRITNKVNLIRKLFERFEKEKLPYLREKLSPEKYKKLEEEFKKLQEMFNKEMEKLEDYIIFLEKSKGDEKKLYEELINHLINKFY